MATDDLGGHPTLNVLKMTALLLLMTAALVGAFVWLHPIVGAVVGFFVALSWMTVGPQQLGKLIASGLNSRIYNEARRLVANGELTPSYMGRNQVCNGFAVVDEKGQMLYLNGRTLKFADVKSIGCRGGSKGEHYVEFVLCGGEAPVQKVEFEDLHTAETFYHRLRNTLGFA